MVLIGRHLLPVRDTATGLKVSNQLHAYIAEVLVLPESPLVGKKLDESYLGEEHDLIVLSVGRDGNLITRIHRDFIINQNDQLILEGSAQNLITAQDNLIFKILPDHDIDLADLDTEVSHIFEAVLSHRSKIQVGL